MPALSPRHLDGSPLGGLENALEVRVDLKRAGLHLHFHAVFLRQVLWYSPRVPAGEASPIFEAAAFDNFAFGIGDREGRLGGPTAVDNQITADFAAGTDQFHPQR
jgi:hypothetical protein